MPRMKQIKSQTVNTQSSSLKVVRQTYLSRADAARSPIAVFDLEMRELKIGFKSMAAEILEEMRAMRYDVAGKLERIDESERRISASEDRGDTTERLLAYMLTKQRQLEEKCEDLESRSRRSNIRIYGVKEGAERDKTMTEFIDNLSLITAPTDPKASPRSIVVKFLHFPTKQQILFKAWSKKGLKYWGMDKLAIPTLSIFLTATNFLQLKAQASRIRFWTLLQILPTALSMCFVFSIWVIYVWQREPTGWIHFVEVRKKLKYVLYIVRICSWLFDVFYESADGMSYFLFDRIT
uniref:Uncharacterized protein n=1 Tax=Sinocyclocheilus anshuiensis TaxID=1608454 RepID=A0A671KRR6_9TELE